MKICLISNLRNDAAVGELQGYNQVMAFFIARELNKLADVYMVRDNELNVMPKVDHAVVISATAYHRLRNGELPTVASRCKKVWCLTDGPIRSIMPWEGEKSSGAYIGMGVAQEFLKPRQTDTPVVLFNAWNATVDKANWDSPKLARMLTACEALSKRGVEIWGMNCALGFAARDVGKPREDDPKKLNYVRWLDVVEAYNRGWVFLDETPKVIELGRVEAAAAGNLLMVPAMPARANPIEGLQYLPQLEWDGNSPLMSDILRAIDAHDSTDKGAISEMVASYFSWPLVAKRLFERIRNE